MKKIKLLLIAVLGAVSFSQSQIEIVSYSSVQNSACSGLIANNTNVSANGICRSSGISENAGGTYNSRNWSTDATLDANDYLEWTVTPNVGFALDLTSMDLRYDRSNTGPTMVNLQLDSGAGFVTIFTDVAVSAGSENNTIDLSAFTGITNILTFRLFAFNASNITGTFDIEERSATDKGIIINGTIVPTCVSTTTWTATGWDNGLPDLTKEAVLAVNYDTNTAANDNSFSACKLTINSGVKLTVRPDRYVEVLGDVTNTGEILIEDKGSFVQKSNTAVFINNSAATDPVIADKVTAPLEEWYEYTYWSSPLQNVAIGDLLPTTSAARLFEFIAANFNDTVMEDLNDNTMVPGRDDIDDEADDWIIIPNTTPMVPGRGYSATLSPLDLAGPAGGTVGIKKSFKGALLNTGIININVDRNDDDPSNMDNNWNLIGNPYASAIDATMFLEKNSYSATNTSGVLEGAIYFWSQVTAPSSTTNGNEPLNFDINDYAILNLTGNTTGERYAPDDFIPSGQGFFVSFSNDFAGNNGDVVFTNDMRVNGNNDKFFRERNVDNKLWINLSSDNGAFSQIVVGYLSGATSMNDGSLYDARRIFSGDTAMLYSTIEDDENEFAIQGRAKEDLTLLETIALGITTGIDEPTLYTIGIDHLQGEFMTRETVYIKDNFLGIIHNLKSGDYTFTSEVGVFKNRFEIVFNADTLSNGENTITEKNVSIVELENDYVRFSIDTNVAIKKVKILNILGQEVYRFEGNSTSEVYNLSNLNKASYIAQIELSNGIQINKKALKK